MNKRIHQIDSIIFDLDGTLWDAVASMTAAWNLGIAQTEDPLRLCEKDVRGIMGLTAEGIKQKLLPHLSLDEQNRVFALCGQEEQRYLRSHGGILYPQVEATLKKLSQEIPLFIVSNCGENYIQSFLDYYDFWQYFQDFEYYARTGQEKDANILRIIQRNKLQKPIYVGDTQGDRDAAYAAKIPFIHAAYGFGKVTECQGSILTFADLLSLVALK